MLVFCYLGGDSLPALKSCRKTAERDEDGAFLLLTEHDHFSHHVRGAKQFPRSWRSWTVFLT